MATRQLRAVAKATKEATRAANLRLTLQTVMAQAPTSRADVARQTGLTRAAVSGLVAELIEAGLLRETGPGESAGGKRPTLIEIDASARQVVAVDTSRTPFRGAVLDLGGTVVHSLEGTHAVVEGDAAVDEVGRLVTDLLDRTDAPVLGIGVGTPGVVDGDGVVVEASNLGWHGVALAERLTLRAGLPVHVANDAHISAIDEYGRREDVDSLVVVRIGRGIGAGIVLDGWPYTGDGHAAGEIGHIEVLPDGPPCRCGRRGCLEVIASVPAILRASGRDPDDVDALAGLGEADIGPLALAAEHLGQVMANLVAVLDVRHLVLGGPVERLGDAFLVLVRDALAHRVLPSVAGELELRRSAAGDDAVLTGAWALVLAQELGVVRR